MANVDFSAPPSDDSGKPESEQVKNWLKAIEEAEKRERDWRKEGRGLVKMYEGGKVEATPFNILYSNTDTLSPALYNNLPRPVVQRRFKDEDPLGKIASDVCKRVLIFLLDNDVGNYEPFDDTMMTAVLGSLVPGRGITRFKYDATIKDHPKPALPIEDRQEPGADDEVSEGEAQETETAPEAEVTYETVCSETVPWDRFLMGYSKAYNTVPWVCFEHFMDRQELAENFGDIGRLVPLDVSGNTSGQDGGGEEAEQDRIPNSEGVNLARVLEVWDKVTKTVMFIAPSYKGDFLKSTPDPLNLPGFFPCPKPLMLLLKLSSLLPTPLYKLYEQQAKELNLVTVRLNKLISMLKVRGFYDSTIEQIEKVLQAEDGVLVAADNITALPQGSRLDDAIWLMPLEKVATVVQGLYLQRGQIKQVIYEITGISDIIRGSSVASETATAQNLKSQWGTLRLKRMQKLVAQYARDCLRIMAEIAFKHLHQATIAQMTGLNFPTAEEKAQAQQQLQAFKAQMPPEPMPGQPPAPPPQPPAEMLHAAMLPSWEDIIGLLNNDLQRNYRIDVETNSTVDADATEDKQDMGELLNAIAQFLNGIAPIVEQGMLPPDAAKGILLAVVRRYKFGPEVEDQLAQLGGAGGGQPGQPPGGPKPDPAAEAAKAQAASEMQLTQATTQAKMEQIAADTKLAQAESAFKMEELDRKRKLADAKFQQQMESIAQKKITAQASGSE